MARWAPAGSSLRAVYAVGLFARLLLQIKNGANMAILKKSLPLAVSLVIASSFAGADQLEETVVVADRVETAIESLAVSVNVMDRELITALGSATLPQLLRSQVGISTTQTGGIGAVSGIRVRGQDSFRTRVLIDGIDISDPSSPQIAPRMEHIVAGSLERVEVLRGTQGLLWGADAGGVISLTSRRGGEQVRQRSSSSNRPPRSRPWPISARGLPSSLPSASWKMR